MNVESSDGGLDQYQQAVVDAANKYGVDPDFALRIARAESNFNPNVKDSSAGAMGYMQLMPETAKDLGVDPRNWKQNIDGGVRYLRQMQNQFGDPQLVAAAYNAGPGRVNAYLSGRTTLPPETQKYVAQTAGPNAGAIYAQQALPFTAEDDDAAERRLLARPSPGSPAPDLESADDEAEEKLLARSGPSRPQTPNELVSGEFSQIPNPQQQLAQGQTISGQVPVSPGSMQNLVSIATKAQNDPNGAGKDLLKWAKNNPAEAAGIGLGALAGAYLFGPEIGGGAAAGTIAKGLWSILLKPALQMGAGAVGVGAGADYLLGGQLHDIPRLIDLVTGRSSSNATH